MARIIVKSPRVEINGVDYSRHFAELSFDVVTRPLAEEAITSRLRGRFMLSELGIGEAPPRGKARPPRRVAREQSGAEAPACPGGRRPRPAPPPPQQHAHQP